MIVLLGMLIGLRDLGAVNFRDGDAKAISFFSFIIRTVLAFLKIFAANMGLQYK
ncbi:MAG: hypothetical protein JSW55_03900 [Chloroflexota bacterium]|nr:MAG: hypothetical protein JSW55_03900 [Chloroflexota bacterium]